MITEYPPNTEETAILAHLADRNGVTLRIYNRLVDSMEQLELTRSKISVDRLLLRQKEGFLSVLPTGNNMFASQFERVLSASSVANLYPLNYSGKTDEHGFYLGRDKYGSNVLVDFDRRTEDKTNSNILILGNSGQGKSYLMKLLLCNLRESGKSVLCLDPEHEYEDLCRNLGGTYIDMMSGEFMINPLEPKAWTDGEKGGYDSPETFKKVTRLSQHISYLKDFFRAYKDFSDAEIDTIEIMLIKLYARFGIGNTVAAIDELYLFLTNLTAIEYIRNGMKRVRKKESSFIPASQNIEDFLLPEIKEFTKPLFSIPTHHFLLNPGNISPAAFIDTLQLESAEFDLIKFPERGTCLYRCGNERYLLVVIAPQYKAKLFGAAGGR